MTDEKEREAQPSVTEATSERPAEGFPDEVDEGFLSAGDDSSVIFDYHRTVIGYHGTRKRTAEALVRGTPFRDSENDDDWLGHGVYFWEYAPQQAWWWAERRYKDDEPAVVGAMIRLGHCLDFLDPQNGKLLEQSHKTLKEVFGITGKALPDNANNHKYLDCLVFQYMCQALQDSGRNVDACRAVFVPSGSRDRYWTRSGVYRGSHLQLCIRNPANILSVWHVRRNGRYGLDEAKEAGDGRQETRLDAEVAPPGSVVGDAGRALGQAPTVGPPRREE